MLLPVEIKRTIIDFIPTKEDQKSYLRQLLRDYFAVCKTYYIGDVSTKPPQIDIMKNKINIATTLLSELCNNPRIQSDGLKPLHIKVIYDLPEADYYDFSGITCDEDFMGLLITSAGYCNECIEDARPFDSDFTVASVSYSVACGNTVTCVCYNCDRHKTTCSMNVNYIISIA